MPTKCLSLSHAWINLPSSRQEIQAVGLPILKKAVHMASMPVHHVTSCEPALHSSFVTERPGLGLRHSPAMSNGYLHARTARKRTVSGSTHMRGMVSNSSMIICACDK